VGVSRTRGAVGILALAVGLSAGVARAQPADGAWRMSLPHQPGVGYDLKLREGDRVVAGTADVDGGRVEGDTMLRLRDPGGDQVAFSDDVWGSLGSRIEYRVPEGAGGTYVLHAECYAGARSCGGTIAVEVEPGVPPGAPWQLRITTAARALLAVDNLGGGVVADAIVEWRILSFLTARLSGAPLALAGGVHGGLAAGSSQLVLSLDAGDIALGVGGGVGVLAPRFGNVASQEIGIVATRVRFGDYDDFHVAFEVDATVVHDAVQLYAMRGRMRIPTRDFDLVFAAGFGLDGTVLGEVASVIWVARDRGRPLLGVSVHVGAAGVYHQPLCRYGAACRETRWYAGPALGLGLEWRP